MKTIAIFIISLIVFMPLSFALSISNVTGTPKHDSAIVTWETDQQASGLVNFGLTTNLGQSASHTGLLEEHTVNLFNLVESRKYYFEIISINSSANEVKDNNNGHYYTFTTKDSTPPPRVSNLDAADIGVESIELEWDPIVVSDFLKYLIYRNNINIVNTTFANYQDISLSADTSYIYAVAAMDTSENLGPLSLEKSIKTKSPDFDPPKISNISLSELTENKANVRWYTDEPSDSIIFYGLNSNLKNTLMDNTSVTMHNIELKGLLNDTVYYYKVKSCDKKDNCIESEVLNFRTGVDLEPPFIDAQLPDWHNGNRLDINGKTESFSRVFIYVDDELKRAKITDESGIFSFSGITLDTKLVSNNVKIVVSDQVGFENSIQKDIKFDLNPPIINITKLPPYSQETSIIIAGTVDEEVTLNIDVKKGDKKSTLTDKVSGLKLKSQERNSVELEWDDIDDAAGYVIYRNGEAMTTYTDNSFIDPLLNKSQQYTYEVAAYSADCTHGQKSDPLIISTPSNISTIDDSFEEIIDYCNKEGEKSKTLKISGKFSQSVDLFDGKNLVIVNATDKAGSSVIIEQETVVETQRPEIIEHNLGELDPSYIQDITVHGKVSKEAGQTVIVTVFVNDEDYRGIANEDGTFSVDVELQRKFYEEMEEKTEYDPERKGSNYYSTYGGEFGTGWKNKIKIIAESQSGLKSSPVERDIVLAICGFGSWWHIELGEPTPTILNPRLMLEGLAQIGIPINKIEWRGGYPNGSINYVDVHSVSISDKDKERYDLDWIQNIQYTGSNDNRRGYVLLTIKKLDSGSLFMDSKEAKEGRSEDELTTLEMENYLYEHRLNDEDCLAPGFGCVRIPVMLEIDFARINQSSTFSRERYQPELTRQKQCWDIEIPIDKRLPTDLIPESFLRNSIKLINQTVSAINQIIKPLNTIKQVTFYACAGSMLLDFSFAFQESFNCEFSESLSAFGQDGGEKWKVEVAQTGQCDQQNYDEDQMSACKQCEEAVLARKNFENTLKWVCDRIFCPSAPSFQKYIKDMSEKEGKNKEDITRSDCAYEDYRPELRYTKIAEAYQSYDENQYEEECSGLHVSDPKCCGYEYMQQWDSACLIMDELKESKCVAYEEQQPGGTSDSDCTGVRKLWNSVAGFCEPDGTPPAEIIRVNDVFSSKVIQKENSYKAHESEKNQIWFRVLPQGLEPGAYRRDAEGTIKFAEIGRITDKIESAQLEWKKGDTSRVATSRVFEPEGELFEIDVTALEGEPKYNKVAESNFIGEYKKFGTASKAKEAYKELQRKIGVSGKEFIVDPTSGMLRSFQCACLPGITSYLNLWKRVLEAVKVCFETILVTGEGNAGVCKAVLSVYVCDLIYDLIACFTKKYSTGAQRTYGGGLGSFFGALTSAGSKVSGSVNERYGDSTIWKSMFAERKLAHAVCLFAFTGTWDFDVNAMLEEDVSIDVNTVSFLYPCTRRFVSFNPATNPAGLTTYNYHLGFGMVAGSKLGYTAELICSDDYSCDTQTGACDCVNIGQQRRFIRVGPGTAARGQVIEEEVFQNVPDANYRYDKVIVRWDSSDSDKDGEASCKIKDAGGSAPVFCSLDVAEASFRCNLGYGEENYIRFYSDPILDKGLYKLGDFINVNLKLSQKQPNVDAGKEFNQYTKFMELTLKNQNQAELWKSSLYNFNGNGIHDQNFQIAKVIEKSDFLKQGSSVEVRVSKSNILAKQETEKFNDNKVIIVVENSEIKSLNVDGDPVTINPSSIFIQNKDTLPILVYKGTQLFFKQKLTDKIEITITSKTSLDGCPAGTQTWFLHVDFYDSAQQDGESSQQRSVYMGQEVKKVIPIKVSCGDRVFEPTAPCEREKQVTVSECMCGTQSCKQNQWCNLNVTNGQPYCNATKGAKYVAPEVVSKLTDIEIIGSLSSVEWKEGGTGKQVTDKTIITHTWFVIQFKIEGIDKSKVKLTRNGKPIDFSLKEDGWYKTGVNIAESTEETWTVLFNGKVSKSFTIKKS